MPITMDWANTFPFTPDGMGLDCGVSPLQEPVYYL